MSRIVHDHKDGTVGKTAAAIITGFPSFGAGSSPARARRESLRGYIPPEFITCRDFDFIFENVALYKVIVDYVLDVAIAIADDLREDWQEDDFELWDFDGEKRNEILDKLDDRIVTRHIPYDILFWYADLDACAKWYIRRANEKYWKEQRETEETSDEEQTDDEGYITQDEALFGYRCS